MCGSNCAKCDDCVVSDFVKIAREVLAHSDAMYSAGLSHIVDKARKVMTGREEDGAGS